MGKITKDFYDVSQWQASSSIEEMYKEIIKNQEYPHNWSAIFLNSDDNPNFLPTYSDNGYRIHNHILSDKVDWDRVLVTYVPNKDVRDQIVEAVDKYLESKNNG